MWGHPNRAGRTCRATASSDADRGCGSSAVVVGATSDSSRRTTTGSQRFVLTVDPHVMPVWGVWHADVLLFSTSPASRKAKNLEQRIAKQW